MSVNECQSLECRSPGAGGVGARWHLGQVFPLRFQRGDRCLGGLRARLAPAVWSCCAMETLAANGLSLCVRLIFLPLSA